MRRVALTLRLLRLLRVLRREWGKSTQWPQPAHHVQRTQHHALANFRI